MGHLYRLASLLGLTPLWSGQIPTATGGYHVLGRRVICGTCGARDRRAMSGELLIPVIMCGGAGTRLWPVSRESMPKQFVPLIDERSTFQQVLGRIGNAELFDRPIVVTHSDFRFVAAEQLRQCDVEADIVLEPSRRNSAMAVAVAAELASRRRPQARSLSLLPIKLYATQGL